MRVPTALADFAPHRDRRREAAQTDGDDGESPCHRGRDLYSLGRQRNAGECVFELTDLVRLGETLVKPRCNEVLTLAQGNAAALAGFGTDATDITELETLIADFGGLLTEPRQAIVARKGSDRGHCGGRRGRRETAGGRAG